MSAEIVPFRLAIPDEALADLRDRLARTRWPERETVDDWSQGVPIDYLKQVCDYWANEYDWRATERRLAALPQFRTDIDGLGIHFVHVRSPHPDALPLVLTHGWPGSIIEFLKVIGPLTDPTAHGGNAEDAFHVVCPSLPGYGFSDKPAGRGWTVERIARAWIELMARLGYERYGAQGGDWGTSVTASMGQQDPEHIAGIHLIPPLAGPDPETFGDLTESEKSALATLKHAAEWENGYALEHSTKPQTIGYALVDSPVALCAWIIEKFRSWTDGQPLGRDELLDNIMLYWLPGTGASAVRLYWESFRFITRLIQQSEVDTVNVPAGCSIFPKETVRPSRRWAAKRFTDIRHWGELDRGGHFAALEQPELFVSEVRTFFQIVR